MEKEQYISLPEASNAFRLGWAALKKYFLEFLLVTLIIGAIAATGSLFSRGGSSFSGFSVFVSIFLSGPLSFGASYFYLKAMRGDDFELTDVFTPFRENYLQVVLASFLSITIIVFGFLLLIIPGFILAIRLSFVPYLVVDEGLEPVEAIKTSWEMTRDYSTRIFIFGLMSFGVIILGLMCMVVGVIPATMLIQAAFSSFYLGVRAEYEMYYPGEEEE